MDKDQTYLLRAAEKEIERQHKIIERALKSKQPRYGKTDPNEFWSSTYQWINQSMEAPPYVQDSRQRDSWLREFWPKELHLAGVLNQSCLIDSNRGWTLVGGRNQVNRYSNIAHTLENGKGWRYYHRKAALAFRTADIGLISEIGREGRNGPMRTMWNVDPARCKLTGSLDYPLKYYPQKGKVQTWADSDFFRICSMPSTDETFNDLGYSAVSRAVEIAKTMIAVYEYDHEQLGARAPRGLLLLKNISENMWEQAMKARDAKLDAYERQFYGGVAVLASAGFDDVDAKLIALSNLPKDFDRKVFTDLLMYAYALVFGYAAEEFWPVASGSLGRGRETEIQHQKATSKGVLDYTNEFQENYQSLLPPTIHFEFDQRDDEGEITKEAVKQAKANVIKTMYETGLQAGAPMIQQWQAQYLLAEAGLIPQEWTETEETVTTNESEGLNEEELRTWSRSEYVQRCAYEMPSEPIVRYHYAAGRGQMTTIWENAAELVRFTGQRRAGRQVRREEGETFYESGGVKITEADVERAITDGRKTVGDDWFESVSSDPMTNQEIEENPIE